MARLSSEKRAELEGFWRAHHEGWERSTLNSAGILRSARPAAEAVRQLAGEVQDRDCGCSGQAALPTRWEPWTYG